MSISDLFLIPELELCVCVGGTPVSAAEFYLVIFQGFREEEMSISDLFLIPELELCVCVGERGNPCSSS